jgi:hypothetical protein
MSMTTPPIAHAVAIQRKARSLPPDDAADDRADEYERKNELVDPRERADHEPGGGRHDQRLPVRSNATPTTMLKIESISDMKPMFSAVVSAVSVTEISRAPFEMG